MKIIGVKYYISSFIVKVMPLNIFVTKEKKVSIIYDNNRAVNATKERFCSVVMMELCNASR